MQDISEDILKKAAEGDVAAFEVIYKATSSFVYNLSLRVVNNREDAEEVTQEVFLIIYDKLKTFRFESSFKTWIYRITANHAINWAKKMARHKTGIVEFDENLVVAVTHETNSSMHQQEQSKVVDQLLSALNPEQRACVVLRNIEGLSYQQIAESLKININTVRSRLNRARQTLLALKKGGNDGSV